MDKLYVVHSLLSGYMFFKDITYSTTVYVFSNGKNPREHIENKFFAHQKCRFLTYYRICNG